MPKERRHRPSAHQPSAKLNERQFASNSRAEHLEIGSSINASGNEILEAMEADAMVPVMSKKEKQQLKHDSFMKRLETSPMPYSKSHARRLKRKAREQVAGGLDDIHAAIATIEEGPASSDAQEQSLGSTLEQKRFSSAIETASPRRRQATKPGQIGEGRHVPLSKAQRKRVLQEEQLRMPLILSNPDFASNPFKTIRTHAENTLLKHIHQS